TTGPRHDDDAGARPDRRAALGAAARADERVAVAAQRVPDVDEPAGARVQGGDVSLVRRRVADVAARRREHEAAREVERRAELLARGKHGDRARPDLAAGRQRELVDPSVRRAGPDEAAVADGRGVRDPVRAGPRRVAARREEPEARAGVGVERERAAVGGREDEDVVRLAAHRHAAEVDRRRVGRARDRDPLAPQAADVLRRDPRRARAGVPPRRVVAEARPVAARADGVAVRRRARTRGGEEREQGGGGGAPHAVVRSRLAAQGPGRVRSDSTCRYASPTTGKSSTRSTHRYRGRQAGWNFPLKLSSRSIWK